MIHIASQLLVLGVFALVALAPGALLVRSTGLSVALPAYLLPPAALVAGLIPMSIAIFLSLSFHWPLLWTVALDVMLVALLSEGAHRSGLRQGARGAVKALHREHVSDLFAWMQGIPGAVWIVLALASVAGFVVGGGLGNDTLYHAAQALKLQSLDHPSFANTGQFVDGGPHPGYLLPAWHETIAIASWIAHTDPATVLWVAPALVLPLVTIAFSGLAFTLLRSHAAALLGGIAFLLADVAMTAPRMIPLENAGQPRIVVWGVVIPLAVASMVLAMWHGAPTARHRALGMTLAAAAVVLVVHVSYVIFFGFAAAGYLAVWVLQAPWMPGVLRRHTITMSAMAAVAVAGLLLLMPALDDLDSFTKSGAAPAGRRPASTPTPGNGNLQTARAILDAGAKLDQPAFARVGVLFVGSKRAYHLRPDRLVRFGGLALIGLCCLPLALLLRRREPFAWYLGGTGLAVLAVSQSDRLFPRLVDAASPAQAQRLDQALPLETGLAFGACALAALCTWMWRHEDYHWQGGAVLVTIVAAGVVNRVTDTFPMINLARLSIDTWPILMTMVLLALLVLLLIVVAIVRVGRWRGVLPAAAFVRPRRLDRLTDPAIRQVHMGMPALTIAPAGLALAVLTLVVGSWSALVRSGDALLDAARHRPSSALRVDELGLLDRGVVRAVRQLDAGSVVLADPATSYRLMAVAPVYVVSSVPGHTANTVDNRIAERYALNARLLAPRTPDATRMRLLSDQRVSAIVTPTERPVLSARLLRSCPAYRIAVATPAWRVLVARGAPHPRSPIVFPAHAQKDGLPSSCSKASA